MREDFDMNDAYDFGMILQKLRKQRGLTQSQLASKIDKESSIISRYEKNLQSPTFETVKAFARIFNVSMDYLSGLEKETSIPTYGLTDEQSSIIKDLVEAFRIQNNTMKGFDSQKNERYQLIGRVVSNLI
ncbi:MAG: helix-turn-helix domain-containing protein [Lachnospiraceae bacterium]|nr:helix-turn-helix domain-containing protein [Lachnospiraceae bacterium]